MDLLKNLFGVGSSTHEKLELNDKELGPFTALDNTGNKLIWKGKATFLGENISLLIQGDKTGIDATQKKLLIDILKDEKAIETKIEKSLQEQYDDGGKVFTNWRNDFKCLSITTSGNDIIVTMEEKSGFNHVDVRIN